MHTFRFTGCFNMFKPWQRGQPMLCEKTWPSGLSNDKNLGLRSWFLSTESSPRAQSDSNLTLLLFFRSERCSSRGSDLNLTTSDLVLGGFKNTYELLNPRGWRALKISMLYKNRIFQCMGKIFCVEFQRFPLKFHTKYLIHTLKDVHFIHRWNFKSS